MWKAFEVVLAYESSIDSGSEAFRFDTQRLTKTTKYTEKYTFLKPVVCKILISWAYNVTRKFRWVAAQVSISSHDYGSNYDA